MRTSSAIVSCAMALAFIAGSRAIADQPLRLPWRLIVASGKHARHDTPVSASVPGLGENDAVSLVELVDGKATETPVQVEASDPPRVWWILSGETPANGERTYELRAGKNPGESAMTVRHDESVVEVRKGESTILRYNRARALPHEGIDPKNGRNAHIHPVRTPGGRVVTDEFPPDHPHQSGLFLAYVRTGFGGRQPDFWNLPGGTGRVQFAALKGTSSGPVFAAFRVEHEHIDLSAPRAEIALREEWHVRVWNVGGAAAGYWLIDLVSTQRCAGETPLRLPEYHYGGMALRGAREWTPENCRVVTAEGRDREAGNHTRTRWCDLSGQVGGKTAGLALMTHPANFRAPEPLRIHPTMPYMVYTPSHLGDWEILPGKAHAISYRFVAHDGELPADELERLWRDFAEPPKCPQ